jgi:hypothetical protein
MQDTFPVLWPTAAIPRTVSCLWLLVTHTAVHHPYIAGSPQGAKSTIQVKVKLRKSYARLHSCLTKIALSCCRAYDWANLGVPSPEVFPLISLPLTTVFNE